MALLLKSGLSALAPLRVAQAGQKAHVESNSVWHFWQFIFSTWLRETPWMPQSL